ncbi:hypothetical protein ACP275_14G215800 [Erythranthe tilingii]
MSWLKLKKLLPTKKFWRAFTNKVMPLKLQKLNKSLPSSSKPNKKLKNQSYKKTSGKLSWPKSLSVQPKKFKKKPKNKNTFISHQKRPPPVFVDQLFVGPASGVAETGSTSKEKSTSSKTSEIPDQKSGPEVSNKENTSVSDNDMNMIDSSADDMWDSMVLASPQMEGIDERAEEFIARFRAQMHRQEMLARRT